MIPIEPLRPASLYERQRVIVVRLNAAGTVETVPVVHAGRLGPGEHAFIEGFSAPEPHVSILAVDERGAFRDRRGAPVEIWPAGPFARMLARNKGRNGEAWQSRREEYLQATERRERLRWKADRGLLPKQIVRRPSR